MQITIKMTRNKRENTINKLNSKFLWLNIQLRYT